MKQLNLFEWADERPSNVIDIIPALIRRYSIEAVYRIPRPQVEAQVIRLERSAA